MSKPIPLIPDIESFRKKTAQGNTIPVFTQLSADYETPLSVYQRVRNGKYSFLLESAENTFTIGRYSFIGSDPRMVFQMQGRDVSLISGDGVKRYESDLDPLAELERIMERFKPVKADELPEFSGGAVGYLGFDCVRYFEPTIGEPPADSLGVPDAVYMIADTLVIYDHLLRRISLVANVCVDDYDSVDAAYAAGREKVERLVASLDAPVQHSPFNVLRKSDEADPEFVSNTTREEFYAAVEKAKEYIKAGDVFQVVPSQRFEMPYSGDPIELFRALRNVNPSPYMFCLEFPDDFALVGSSPELQVRCIDGTVEVRPIAGTRWRGATPQEDEALANDLLADPKERAEHIMLVDLARNDIGRVADFQSVDVNELMVIERYSHVMHIVSNVTGRLKDGFTAYDVMRASFPAGTVSGAPKVRALQIIYELEKNKRCAYAGTVGYFGFDGDFDSCITLRTCVVNDGKAFVQAGAGVVADSSPEYEYQETRNKARGMMYAIRQAQMLADGEH
ncbi:anthranilate synthase component I [Sulfuriroseicoccus oceanibius]|uniref:Anthranilate synthase component 1 n=1 Tax=Sulfuriroseicoccus oceanibius TaxID=2707525 RepID=A0A6B3L8P4_9BACT|nr:anthranilate synthase component I [Sulfuriroseicoccus oceanibius]QQL43811.1 anthranilate synthase component I [Sulfuriroseicoccus oceanibius]